MTEDQTEGASEPTKSSGGLVKVIVPILLLIGIAGGWFVSSSMQTKAELAANDELKALGAFPQLDVGRKFVSTLMIREKIDDAMPHVAKLRKLNTFDAERSDFGDEHVESILGNKGLNSLTLSQTKITDAGVAKLKSMGVKDLYLSQTPITAAALDSVVQMPALEILDVSHTPVATNLAKLKEAQGLVWLRMDGVDISSMEAEAVEILLALPKLGRLTFSPSTGFSEASVDRLKNERPQLFIDKVEDLPADEQ